VSDHGVRARQAARTRERILAAARERFAEVGYEAATVRTIAAAAEVDPAAVIRYFTSKEKLFFEVFNRDSVWPTLEDCPDERIGEGIVRVWLWDWEGRDRAPLLALVRAASSGGQVADQVRTMIMDTLLAVLRSRVVPDEHAEERIALASVAVIGLVMNRYVLELEPLASMPAEDVVALLGPVLQHHVRGPMS
jgi:AcrR family transcriptional regulator